MTVLPELLSKDDPISPDSVLDSTGDVLSGVKGAVDKVGGKLDPNASNTTDSDSASDSDEKSTTPKIGKDEILKNGKLSKRIQLK